MMTIEKAIALASIAHEGQKDKGGAPYILHPLKIMMAMDTENEKILAVLHDVLEDTDLTITDLIEEGLPGELVEPLLLLTREPGVSYRKYLEALVQNPLSTKVKLADLSHNSDLTRIPSPTLADYKRVQEYQRYQQYLVENGSVLL